MALTAIPTDQLAAALREGEEASASELLALASSKDVKIRESLAARPDCPVGVQIVLAQDSKSQVRQALASNPAVGASPSVLAILSADKDADVVVALVENEATPESIISAMRDHNKKGVRRAADARASRGADWNLGLAELS